MSKMLTTWDQMRTPKGLAYEKYCEKLKQLLQTGTQKAKAAVERANAGILAMKATPGQVHVDSAMSTMSVMYANDDFIGERLMPVLLTGGKLSGKYFVYPKRERFGYPDDAADDRSSVNETNQSRTTDSFALKGRALKEWVSIPTLFNQDAPLNELMDAQANVLYALAFKREQRLAAILGVGGSYSGNTAAVSTGWATGGDPLGDIDAAKAACWNGAGPGQRIAFCSLTVWNILKKHPAVLDLFKFNGSSPGMATTEMVARWFGFADILVAESRQDTANEGQTASYSRIWPDVFGVVRVCPPSIRNAGFGFTFRDRPVRQVLWYDQAPGTDGGYYTKGSCHEDHKIVAPDTSYLLTGVAA